MKTFTIFATLLSLAFASNELLQCMDRRAGEATPPTQTEWEAEHGAAIEACAKYEDVVVDVTDQCNPDEQKNSGVQAHQHELCIFTAFGWVDTTTGSLNMEKVMIDFSADEAFAEQMQASMNQCVKGMMGKEQEKAQKMHDDYVKACPQQTADMTKEEEAASVKKFEQQLLKEAEFICLFLEMGCACPEMDMEGKCKA